VASGIYLAQKKKSPVLPIVAAVLVIAALLVVLVYVFPIIPLFNNTSSSPTPTPSPSPTPLPTTTPSPTAASPTSTPDAKQQELVNYVLSLINTDRQNNGLANVTLGSVASAQRHADEMLAQQYISHWNTQGYKPYMRYSWSGGTGAVGENCARRGQIGNLAPIDVKAQLDSMEWSMMNNDSASNWAHRDNILNALHNKVNIGIAYDNHNVFLVQDFENDYVAWSTLNVDNGVVTLKGTVQNLPEQNATIKQIVICYDNPSALTPTQLMQPPYNAGYDAGTYVATVLPENWQATQGITITATTWTQNGASFEITFSLAQAATAAGNGVYTLYMETGSSTDDSLLSYSIMIG
jgi:uncharacterized protein YkwD